MQITVNGEPREVQGPLQLPQLLAELALPAYNGVAVLLNGEVVRRSDWPQTTVNADDALEIVRATVGG
ncbi:MAG TPA: sulfur carrier protein ThiS [bacterium]|nr:sulfur carrier protein ThiS [bacterium]